MFLHWKPVVWIKGWITPLSSISNWLFTHRKGDSRGVYRNYSRRGGGRNLQVLFIQKSYDSIGGISRFALLVCMYSVTTCSSWLEFGLQIVWGGGGRSTHSASLPYKRPWSRGPVRLEIWLQKHNNLLLLSSQLDSGLHHWTLIIGHRWPLVSTLTSDYLFTAIYLT